MLNPRPRPADEPAEPRRSKPPKPPTKPAKPTKPTTETPRMLDAALHYARLGVPVFPLRPGGKEPITPNGFKDASTDEAQLRRWWKRTPQANIGVPTGAASGWDVLDFDPRNGGDVDGVIPERPALPATRTARSGSGGLHGFFQHHDGLSCKNVLYTGVDLKADGGYIVVAPSVHPCGGRYEWLDAGAALAPLPEWVAADRAAQSPQEAPDWRNAAPAEPIGRRDGGRQPTQEDAQKWLTDALAKVGAGEGRNDAGFWLACQLLDNGIPDPEAAIIEYAARVPDKPGDPYTAREAWRSLASAARYPRREPARSQKPLDFADRKGKRRQGQDVASGAGSAGGNGSSGPTDSAATADDDSEHQRASQPSQLLAIALTAELFRTPDGHMPHARAKVNDHYETWKLGEKGGGFRRWLVYQYLQMYGRVPSESAVSQALSGIIAVATFRGGVHPVHLRLAEHEGKIYHDLGDASWRCVEIGPDGWRIVESPPVYFRRPAGFGALPLPEPGGSLDELRPLIGPQSDDEWMLICAWLVGSFHPRGPYPHLSLNGHQGAGKSTKTRMLRMLIDPAEAATRGEPNDKHDLAVMAHNNRVVALDNLSHMPGWLSDFLCQLSTGAGEGYRTLYADDEETIFKYRRPVIFNGIEEVATRGDLLDRSLSVTLARIAEGAREAEDDLEVQFQATHGRILGAIYDAVVSALRYYRALRIEKLPRMADFAKWIVAAAPALGWDAAHFLEVYTANRAQGVAVAIDASPVAAALLRFMEDRIEWLGSASALYELLTPLAGDAVQHTRAWPASPRGLSGSLKRLAPSLEAGEGLLVAHGKDDTRDADGRRPGRFISITLKQTGAGDANGDAKSSGDANHIHFASPDDARAYAGASRTGDAGDAGDAKSRPFSTSMITSGEVGENERGKSGKKEAKEGILKIERDFASPASQRRQPAQAAENGGKFEITADGEARPLDTQEGGAE